MLQTQIVTSEILCIVLQDCLPASKFSSVVLILVQEIFMNHHHHQANMELDFLLTLPSLTILKVFNCLPSFLMAFGL